MRKGSKITEPDQPPAKPTSSAYIAPLGTPLPLAQEPLPAQFINVGAVGQPLDIETTSASHDVFSWGGDLVATVQDRFTHTVTFQLFPDAGTVPDLLSLETSTWVFDTALGRVVIPAGRVLTVTPKVTLKLFPDVNANSTYLHNRTWAETWNDHVGAALNGDTQLAKALMTELTTGYVRDCA